METEKIYYLVRLGFFKYKPDNADVGFLDMTTYLLHVENAELAVEKVRDIEEKLISYHEEAKIEIDGVPVHSDYIGVLNFEQLCESLENGAELFNEILPETNRSEAFRHVMSKSEIESFVDDEKRRGRSLIFKPEFSDDDC